MISQVRDLRPFVALSSPFSSCARLAVLLLAVLQFVAPTWHICSMGGAKCHDHNGRQECHLPVAASTGASTNNNHDEKAAHSHALGHAHSATHSHPAERSHSEAQSHCEEPSRCKCESGANAASLSNNVLQTQHDSSSGENCLARLLLGLPGSVASPFVFATGDSFYFVFQPTVTVLHSLARLRQPPARGPPAISFL